MRITYDRHTDTLSLVLKEGAAVAESDEGRPGVILDYDAAGDLVSLEILDASRRVTEARRVEPRNHFLEPQEALADRLGPKDQATAPRGAPRRAATAPRGRA